MRKFDSEVGNRLKKAFVKGVALRACGMTMGKMKLAEKDLYPEAGIRRCPGRGGRNHAEAERRLVRDSPVGICSTSP
jgi:hypothetical protein